jgi:hypothetical protein
MGFCATGLELERGSDILKNMKPTILSWLPIAVAASILCGLVYGLVQQDIRTAANDPELQLAEDAAVLLGSGISPLTVAGEHAIDISKSLAPYLIVLNASKVVVASSAVLAGTTPVPPAGVFDHALRFGENRITWEPVRGVRSAIVVVPYQGHAEGYVIAGRSLREVERRESDLLHLVCMGWIAVMAGSFAACFFTARRRISRSFTE